MGEQREFFSNDQMGVLSADCCCYRRLIRNPHVCHGAFRLWHYMRDRASAKNGSRCWPGQRLISREMKCKRDFLAGWIQQLEAAGYLQTESKGPSRQTVYILQDGRGVPFFGVRSGPQSGATPRSPKRTCQVPKGGPPSGPLPETKSNPSTEVIPRSEREGIPQFDPVSRNQFLREYERLVADASKELRAAKGNVALHTRVLSPQAAQSCTWLHDQARTSPTDAASYLSRIAQIEADAASWVLGPLNEKGQALVRAWEARIQEIKDAMNGRIR